MATSRLSPSASTRLNANDQGAAVILTAGIMLGISAMTLVLRLYQRWPWRWLFKLEDAMLILSSICSVANVATAALAVEHGLGQHARSLTTDQISQTKTVLIANFATVYLVEGFAAISFAILLRNIDTNKLNRAIMIGLCGIVTAWMLAGIITFAVAGDTAVAMSTRGVWIGLGVVSMLIQLTLITSAMQVVWPLQMPLAGKITCSFWFGLCIPSTIAATATRLAYTPVETFGDDFTWKDNTMVIILLIESNLMIVSAACSSFRSFMNKVSTGFLVAEPSHNGSKGGSGKHTGPASNVFNRLGSGLRNTQGWHNELGSTVRSTAERNARNPNAEGRDNDSFGSEGILVRKSVDIDNDWATGP